MKFLKAETFLSKGNDKFILEDYEGALQEYTKAIEVDPNNVFAYESRGTVELHLENYSSALLDFTKAIKIEPRALFYCNRGIAKYLLNDRTGALLDWDKAAELGELDAYDLIKNYCM